MFDPTTLTGFHTWLSIVALAAGMVVVLAWLRRSEPGTWMTVFLVTAVLTNLTGFLFPFSGFLPSHGVGIISTVVLAVAAWGWWGTRAGSASRVTRIAAVAAEYFLFFVAVAQVFQKVPSLGGQGTGFALAQGVLLVVFVVIGWRIGRREAWATA